MQARQEINRALVLVAMCVFAGTAFAQGPGYGQGQEGGPGYGMGPGMMGGYGPGYGPRGYGPGGGMGPGMMRGREGVGPGAGMGRGRWERAQRALGLSEDQRAKVAGIFEDTRRKNWDALGQIRSERFKLREMVRGDTVDPNAVVEQKKKVDELKRQVMRARLEARNQVFALLTPEQREKARSLHMPGGRGRN